MLNEQDNRMMMLLRDCVARSCDARSIATRQRLVVNSYPCSTCEHVIASGVPFSLTRDAEPLFMRGAPLPGRSPKYSAVTNRIGNFANCSPRGPAASFLAAAIFSRSHSCARIWQCLTINHPNHYYWNRLLPQPVVLRLTARDDARFLPRCLVDGALLLDLHLCSGHVVLSAR